MWRKWFLRVGGPCHFVIMSVQSAFNCACPCRQLTIVQDGKLNFCLLVRDLCAVEGPRKLSSWSSVKTRFDYLLDSQRVSGEVESVSSLSGRSSVWETEDTNLVDSVSAWNRFCVSSAKAALVLRLCVMTFSRFFEVAPESGTNATGT